MDFLKRCKFAPKRLGVTHSRRNLVVFRSVGILRHEIDLKGTDLAYANLGAATKQFQEDDVLKDMADIL